MKSQRGAFVLGLVVGLLLGLALALGVALYITKAPVPFVNKVPQRTAEQDAAEAERNRQWDPNAPLAGKSAPRPGPPPAAAASAAAAAAAAASDAAAAQAAAASSAKPATAARPAKDPAAILAGQADGTAPARPAGREVPLGTAGAASGVPATPASGVRVQFYVQVGAYSTPEDAEAQRAKVAMTGLAAKVLSREQAGRTVYRVRTGPYDNRTAAEDVQDKLTNAGMEANLVRVER